MRMKEVPARAFEWLVGKALSRQEGPKICWDARFLNAFFI